MYSPEEYGRTQLHEAVIENDLNAVKSHISEGADINAGDSEKWTPLHYAAQGHKMEIGKLLIDAGAEVDALDSNGNTPLWRAIMNDYHGEEFIEFLKANGADPELNNIHGVSPLDLENTTE